MENEILSNLDNPGQLEKLYRTDKPTFKRVFKSLYPGLQNNTLAEFWNERLNYPAEEIHWGSRKELAIIIFAALLTGLIAKLPALFDINEEFFYSRNLGFIVFPTLMAFFAWKNKLSARKIMLIMIPVLASLLFINYLPDAKKSDTLTLSCIYLPLFLWGLLGFTFVGGNINRVKKRLEYLRYNGDLAVMAALILLAGGIMTSVTVGLFGLTGLNFQIFYFEYIVVFGLAAVPLTATYLTQTNPQLVGKVSPVIAKIFSPLVFIILVIYLGTMAYSERDPFNDREFLLMFNALLIGVMAIIFFSVAETTQATKSKAEVWVLFLLSAITIVVNGIALSAILFRISEWGITPNRAAVLGSNILMLIHLILVTFHLFRAVSATGTTLGVRKIIVSYLPVYFIWTIIVTFIFPFVFAFK